jgi:hypothetical protein
LADGGTDAVITGISTSSNGNALGFGIDEVAIGVIRVQQRLGVGRQKVHGKVHTIGVTARDVQITGHGRARADDDCIVLSLDVCSIDVDAYVRVWHEANTFSSVNVDTALQQSSGSAKSSAKTRHSPLVELHVGNTSVHQTADTVGTLIDSDGVASRI